VSLENANLLFSKYLNKNCTSISVVDFGYNNRSYIVLCDDGEEYVLRLCGKHWERYKTVSEVNSLRFIKENTTLPVPIIYHYDSSKEEIGFEYLIMEKMPGRLMYHEWDNFSLEEKEELVKDIARYVIELRSIRFDKIGGFDEEPGRVGKGVEENSGPFNSEADFIKFTLAKKINTIENNDKYVPQRKFLPQLNTIFENLLDYTLFEHNTSFYMTHYDWDSRNILVENNKVSAILDWEFAGSYPFHVEYKNSFDFAKDLSDSERCKEIFYNILESNNIETPRSVSDWSEREEFDEFLENVAPWWINHMESDDVEGMLRKLQKCEIVITAYLKKVNLSQ